MRGEQRRLDGLSECNVQVAVSLAVVGRPVEKSRDAELFLETCHRGSFSGLFQPL